MLTRELLRFKVTDGKLVPGLLKSTPSIVDLADRLLTYWRGGIGQKRGELEDGATPVLHQSRALVVARGLQKLLLDACEFTAPASCADVRGEALALSAQRFAAATTPGTILGSADEHRAAVAEALHLPPEELSARLYGDLPDNEILVTVPSWNAAHFIARYNLALCQGLLLGAREMTVTVHDRDLGRRRRLLTALRFHRLLAEVRYAPGAGDDERPLQLAISGPDAVLDQASRYGLNLALFLPVLCGLRHWEARADVRLPRRDVGASHAVLELTDEIGLASDRDLSAHIPDELRDLRDTLADKLPDRRCEDALPRTLPDGTLVMPDLRLVGKSDAVDIELFHRWHAHALAKRIDQLAAGVLPGLIIGVDRAVAKSPAGAALVATPTFARYGFLFNDIPAPRAVLDALKRQMPSV